MSIADYYIGDKDRRKNTPPLLNGKALEQIENLVNSHHQKMRADFLTMCITGILSVVVVGAGALAYQISTDTRQTARLEALAESTVSGIDQIERRLDRRELEVNTRINRVERIIEGHVSDHPPSSTKGLVR